MKNLSAATRQKLAIMLKSKESQNGGVLPNPGSSMGATAPALNSSPNLAPPPAINGMHPALAALNSNVPNAPGMAPVMMNRAQNFLPRFPNLRNKLKASM